MMLRVVIVAPPFYEVPPDGYGGTELVCGLLADGLIGLGHAVTVVGAGARRTRADFVPTFASPRPEGGEQALRAEIEHVARAAAVIGDMRPDIVHDHTAVGPLTAAFSPFPTVATVHGAVRGPDAVAALLPVTGRWCHLVAVSAAQRGDAPGLPWAAVVHNGVDLTRYEFMACREDYVLYLGRVSPYKGTAEAIVAARAAGRRLVIAGGWTTPAERAYFDAEIRPMLGPRVEWAGPVGMVAKADLLSRAACLIFPARWHEPFGLVLVEAMASGTPVVALRAGAVSELVPDGVAGVLCDTAAELPGAIEAAAGLDGQAARAHAARHFGADTMTRRYLRLYRRLIASG